MSNLFGIKKINGMPIQKSPYPEDFVPACDYINCFAGQGLAGRGICFLEVAEVIMNRRMPEEEKPC